MKVLLVWLRPMQQVGKSDKTVLLFGLALNPLIKCSFSLGTCECILEKISVLSFALWSERFGVILTLLINQEFPVADLQDWHWYYWVHFVSRCFKQCIVFLFAFSLGPKNSPKITNPPELCDWWTTIILQLFWQWGFAASENPFYPAQSGHWA